MAATSETLSLSIGDQVPNARLASKTYAGVIDLHGKQVFIDLSSDAVRTSAESAMPILCEVELYFSCLVRKQVRFTQISPPTFDDRHYTRVIPGFYASFRAVATQQCSIQKVGDKPPVETMPIHKPERFVPNWIRIDFHDGRWIGEYGFKRTI